jgi:hypothetical protein
VCRSRRQGDEIAAPRILMPVARFVYRSFSLRQMIDRGKLWFGAPLGNLHDRNSDRAWAGFQNFEG